MLAHEMLKYFLMIYLFSASIITVSAQATEGNPRDWILYERANAFAAQHEYGRALDLYKEAIASAGIFPEAEMGIGDIFLEEGEFRLARQQYEKAYNLRKAFRIAEMQYEVLYKLANLFQEREMYSQMVDALEKIIADDRSNSDADGARTKTQIQKNFLEKGLDHVVFLYQFSVPFAMEAHSKLGWFYYRTGRYDRAVQELLYAVIYATTAINASLRDRDADYQFQDFSDMLAKVEESRVLSAYVSRSSFFHDLYYLAGSAYAFGYPTHAAQIWTLLAKSKLAGTYSSLAARQLKRPWTEKLLTPGRSGT